MKTKTYAFALMATAFLASHAKADIYLDSLGTVVPPATVGGYSMVPFSADGRTLGDTVTGITLPVGAGAAGSLSFDNPLVHYRVTGDPSAAWSTWSHNYRGDVYQLDQFALDLDTLQILLPLGTTAFYFYTQPNEFGPFNITVASASLAETMSIQGDGGAQGFKLWATGGSTLDSITITSPDTLDGFAIGEFGINGSAQIHGAPDGGVGTGLFAVLLIGLGWISRRFAR
jgi:hypothetical protein